MSKISRQKNATKIQKKDFMVRKKDFVMQYKGITFKSKATYENYLAEEKGENEMNEADDFEDCMKMTEMIKDLSRGSTLFENLSSQKFFEFMMKFNKLEEVHLQEDEEDSIDEQDI